MFYWICILLEQCSEFFANFFFKERDTQIIKVLVIGLGENILVNRLDTSFLKSFTYRSGIVGLYDNITDFGLVLALFYPLHTSNFSFPGS